MDEVTESPTEFVNTKSNTSDLPAVSVIMAVYNGERYISGAIDSILCQTHEDFEFIIVDDGSTDSTAEILSEFAARDKRIVIISQENQDQPASLNTALRVARHDWVAVIDHDDVSVPTRLERQLQFLLENPEVRVLGTHVTYIDARGEEIGSWTGGPTSIDQFRGMRRRNERVGIIHPSAMMHRHTILELGGYRPEFGPSADNGLWSRVSDDHVIMTLPERLMFYRKHTKSMSMTRFAEQKLLGRWIRACQDARRRGMSEPTLEEHIRSERGLLGVKKLIVMRDDRLRHSVRLRRLAKKEGNRRRNIMLWALIFLLNPALPFGALWRKSVYKTRALANVVRRSYRSLAKPKLNQ